MKLEDYPITTEKLSELTGYSIQYLRILARTGMIPAKKRMRQWRFNKRQIDQHFETQNADAHATKC